MTYQQLIDEIGICVLHEFARRKIPVTYSAVLRWKQRNNIPPYAWRATIDAAEYAGIQLTIDDLLDMAENRKRAMSGGEEK